MVNRISTARLMTARILGMLPAGGHCLLCGLAGCARGTGLCAPCSAVLPRIGAHCCRCGLPLPGSQGRSYHSYPCGQCLLDPPPYSRCIAPLLYEPPVAQLIAHFKYGGQLACGRLLCDELLHCLRREPEAQADLIIPVPLHWRRRWTRGFNQAEIIGDEVSRALNIPLRADLLIRSRHTPPQQSLSASQRHDNLRAAFMLRRPLSGKNAAHLDIALVDDVVTTGATTTEIARLLLAAGARSVQVWCLARTP